MNLFYKVRYKLSLVGRRITAHEIAQFQEEEKEDKKRAVEKNFIYSSLYRVFTEKRFVLLSHLQLVLQMLLFLPFFQLLDARRVISTESCCLDYLSGYCQVSTFYFQGDTSIRCIHSPFEMDFKFLSACTTPRWPMLYCFSFNITNYILILI